MKAIEQRQLASECATFHQLLNRVVNRGESPEVAVWIWTAVKSQSVASIPRSALYETAVDSWRR
jgi:hypothetical protein